VILLKTVIKNQDFEVKQVGGTGRSNDKALATMYIQMCTPSHRSLSATKRLNPASIFHSFCLNLTSVGNHDLVGSIPTEIGVIDQLKTLDLSLNNLTGNIPQELGNLKNLETLFLNQNGLMGSVPDELCRIRELIVSCGKETNQVICTCCKNCNENVSVEDYYYDDNFTKDAKDLEQNSDMSVDGDNNRKALIVAKCTKISGETVRIEESPQYFAMNWMVKNDRLRLGVETRSFVERYVMAVMYYSLCEESFNFRSWLSPNKNHCSFQGVTCNTDKMITALTFDRMNMVGMLPLEISEIIYVTFIDMSHNRISGGIPSSWELLLNLQTLLLIENEITGPMTLCSLYSIETIEVDCDKISCGCCRSCLTQPVIEINESTNLQPAPSPTRNTLQPTRFPIASGPTLFPIPFFEHTDGASRFRPDDDRSKEIRLELQKVSTTPDFTPSAMRIRAQDWIIFEDPQALSSASKYLEERYILAVLYYVLDGKSWTSAKHWFSNTTYCYWEGVYCDGGESIEGINLSFHNLTGTIPYEIAQLSHLSSLNLSSNHIQESIIDELGEMSQLGKTFLISFTSVFKIHQCFVLSLQ